jgi:hypothetical protein
MLMAVSASLFQIGDRPWGRAGFVPALDAFVPREGGKRLHWVNEWDSWLLQARCRDKALVLLSGAHHRAETIMFIVRRLQ